MQHFPRKHCIHRNNCKAGKPIRQQSEHVVSPGKLQIILVTFGDVSILQLTIGRCKHDCRVAKVNAEKTDGLIATMQDGLGAIVANKSYEGVAKCKCYGKTPRFQMGTAE